MEPTKVEEIMVPLAEYATCDEDANLYDAVVALEKAQEEFDHTKYRHRAVLVLDKNQKVVGKLSQIDVLRALEPRYKEIGDAGTRAHSDFSKLFLKSMMDHYKLWDPPLSDICRKAFSIRARDVMNTLSDGEYVDKNATINEAIHQLVMGHHQSLLVTSGPEKEIVGILRLTDVFMLAFQAMKKCELPK